MVQEAAAVLVGAVQLTLVVAEMGVPWNATLTWFTGVCQAYWVQVFDGAWV